MAGETVREVLNHVWSALDPLGHPFALIGGIALAVWSHPRATRDVDLLSWATQLNLNIELNQSWGEAYPDEDLPTANSG